MANRFVVAELFLYLLVAFLFVSYAFVRKQDIGIQTPKWLTFETIMLPSLLLSIQSFSLLIFNFSILPVYVIIIAFALQLHLYEYIRRIDEFTLSAYWSNASRLIAFLLSACLIGIMGVRLITYFR